jgi:DNA-binding NarL/FixJ family response regulator
MVGGSADGADRRATGSAGLAPLPSRDMRQSRKGFRLILDAETDIAVAGEAGDGATAVSMCAALRPDVVLMDVRMPGRDGIEATRDIVAAGLPSKVLILTTFDLDDYVYAGLRAGASGFLLKDTQPDDLADAIRTIAAGDAVLAPGATKRLIHQFAARLPEPPSSRQAAQIRQALTGREQDVFSLIATGMSNGEIAASLAPVPEPGSSPLASGSILGRCSRLEARLRVSWRGRRCRRLRMATTCWPRSSTTRLSVPPMVCSTRPPTRSARSARSARAWTCAAAPARACGSSAALGHFLPAERPALFAGVHQSLRPGGIFAFPIGAPPPVTSSQYWALLGFDLAMRARNAVWRPPFIMYYRTCSLSALGDDLTASGFTWTTVPLTALGQRENGSPQARLVLARRAPG